MGSGNQIDFAEIVGQYGTLLRGYLVNYCGDVDVAEDVLQETLLRVERGLAGFRGDASLKTWVLRIATNAAIDHFRRRDVLATVVPIDDAGPLPDGGPELGEPLVIREMNTCIREQIDSLPDTYRAALVLHDLEGLTAVEVAEICDVSLATAKIRIHRGRQRLRRVLSDGCAFYYDADLNLRCDRKAPESSD